MNTAQQVKQLEGFEQVLLSYAEMCYSVAFALTRNPRRAQDLARYALTRAWLLRATAAGRKDIKHTLLKTLRERFLEYYCQSPGVIRNAATPGQDAVVMAQGVEPGVEKVSLGASQLWCRPRCTGFHP